MLNVKVGLLAVSYVMNVTTIGFFGFVDAYFFNFLFCDLKTKFRNNVS